MSPLLIAAMVSFAAAIFIEIKFIRRDVNKLIKSMGLEEPEEKPFPKICEECHLNGECTAPGRGSKECLTLFFGQKN